MVEEKYNKELKFSAVHRLVSDLNIFNGTKVIESFIKLLFSKILEDFLLKGR